MKNRPVIGQRVRVNAIIVKQHTTNMNKMAVTERQRVTADMLEMTADEWYVRFEGYYSRNVLPNNITLPLEGVYVGWRTLGLGRIYTEYDNGYVIREFLQDDHVEGWIIYFDARRNPVYVLPEDVEIVT